VLPGNHDAYDERSVYRRGVWHDRPPSVHLLDAADADLVLPELDLTVWGRPVVDHWREFRPLADMPARPTDRWRVAMGHGHYELPGDDPRSSPIFPEHIAAASADYVALGHWDVQTDVSQGPVIAFYSGAPHRSVRGSRALLVTLDERSGVQVEPLALDPGLIGVG
jgi:DNA repair exonuclease SbcCD nuclease subunit